jgi:hypothetical protein
MTVSFETAVKLKEAGFLQPLAFAGHFWYGKKSAGIDSEAGSLCVLIGTDRGEMRFRPVDGIENENNRFFVFAPTATDILQELDRYILSCYAGNFQCETFARTCAHENPAEACALAWLARYCEPIKIPVHGMTCMTDSSLSIGGE